ncbi:hypothetical protein LXL04_030471 [Taraxacum kok-saghyz]
MELWKHVTNCYFVIKRKQLDRLSPVSFYVAQTWHLRGQEKYMTLLVRVTNYRVSNALKFHLMTSKFIFSFMNCKIELKKKTSKRASKQANKV